MTQLLLSGVNYQSESFGRVLAGMFSHKLSLLNNIITLAPDQIIAPVEGDYASVPQWNALSGDADVITNGLTTTINAPSQFKHRAVWVEREKAWGADEIIMTIAGSQHDATTAIANMIGEYWANQMHNTGISVITGSFASALAATHVSDDTGSTITKEKLALAKLKLGDNAEKLKSLVVNSKVYTDALVGNMIATNLGDALTQQGALEKLLGMNVYQSDKLTATAGVYPSILGMPGAMLYKTRSRKNAALSNANKFNVGNLEVELYRNSITNGGYDALITRLSYCVVIPGVQYDDTGGVNPTETVLATSTSWTKVQTDDKLIPLVMYKSA
ncbi:hypothetical protein IT417_01155 [bacterium]|nr:hypothetical protein [bacterium]